MVAVVLIMASSVLIAFFQLTQMSSRRSNYFSTLILLVPHVDHLHQLLYYLILIYYHLVNLQLKNVFCLFDCSKTHTNEEDRKKQKERREHKFDEHIRENI